MRATRAVVFAAMGAFSLGAQTALFREYLVVYGGNELGTGIFFSSWLLWVGIGAIAARGIRRGSLSVRLALYPPALALQLILIKSLRDIAGVEPTDLFPTGTLFLLTFLMNSPVSFVTGFLFPLAARADRSVTRVYVLECAGSFVGGAGVTGFLAAGIGTLPALSAIAALVAAAGIALSLREGRRSGALLHSMLLGAALLALLPPVGSSLERVQWRSLHPGAEHVATFESPYRRLDVGRIGGQTVAYANGEILSAWPAGDAEAEDAALLAAQPVKRERALVAGLGALPLATALRAAAFQEVFLVTPDETGLRFLVEQTPADLGDLVVRHGDLRRADFRATLPTHGFDLVVVDPGDPDTVLAARHFTRDFYEEAADLLADGGVFATSVASAENWFGTELARYGASVRATLEAVFDAVVIAPGERAWFLADTGGGRATVDPNEVERRLRALNDPARPYPPERIHMRLPERRTAFVREVYGPRPGEDLVSTDDRPLVYLLNLLVLGRVEGTGLSGFARGVAGAGIAMLLLPFAAILLFRARHVRARGGDGGRFAGVFLLAMTGGTAIALDLVLLLAYQERFGLLMTNVGLANALFLLGLTAGGLLGSRLPKRAASAVGAAVAVAAFAALLPTLADTAGGEIAFLGLFALSGAVCGIPFPLAASIHERASVETGRAGAVLEAADHLGGAAGALLVGALLVPLFGVAVTARFLAAALLAVPALVGIERLVRPEARAPFASFPFVRTSAVLATIVVAVAAVSYPVRKEIDRPNVRLDKARLLEFVPGETIREVEGPFVHYDAWDAASSVPVNHSLATMAVVTDVTGYGGPLNLLLSIDRDGTIRRVELLESKETPAYIEELPEYLSRLEGRDASERFRLAGDLAKITGATVSCRAAIETVNRARDRVFTDLLRRPAPAGEGEAATDFGATEAWTLALFVLAVPVFLRAGSTVRVAFLAVVLAVLGIWLNQQLSARHVFDLLALTLPPPGNMAHLLLIGGAVVLGALFGPVYCGLICPFGAAQELLGRIGLARRPSSGLDAKARFVKHVVLAVALVGFLTFGADAVLGFDPLATAFSGKAGTTMWVLIGLVAFLSLFLFRFWCRYLCPTGALLSLTNRLGVLLGIARPKAYPRCDLGVKSKRDVDCIQCNRCLEATGDPS